MNESIEIESVHLLAPDVKLIRFKKLPFAYKSGQFLTFIVSTAKEEVRRSFSLVSCPDLHEQPAICVKRISNGIFSRFLVDDAKSGDALVCTGVSGFFTLPENEQPKQIYFFAAGTGITPVLPLIKSALLKFSRTTITLIYSSRSEAKTLFKNDLDLLQQQFPDQLKIRYIWSATSFPEEGRLQRVLLEKILKETQITELNECLYYLCGPYEYMRMISFTLRLAKVPDANIRSEQFVQGRPVPILKPPNTDAHTINMELNGFVYQFHVQYPQTILKAAKLAGLHIPYSCEFGRCGTCVAKCTAGKIWMYNNEVLTDQDLQKGFILTCVGFPLTDSTISFSE